MSNDLIELCAQAIDNADPGESKYERIGIDACREYARAVIAAIEASGTHVLVPVEPTDDMKRRGFWANVGKQKEAGQIISRAWPEMLSARPKVTT